MLVKDSDQLPEGYLSLGNAQYPSGDRQKALTAYSRSIELRPNDPRAYYNRGILYKNLNKPDLSEADHRKAKELDAPH